MRGISCNSNLLSDLPIDEAIDLLAKEGYQGIDICMELTAPFVPLPTPHMSPDDDRATRERVRRRAKDAGIVIAALNAHTNISERDPARRKANTEFLKGAVQLAADLDAPTVVTTGGGKMVYGYEDWFFEWSIETLAEVLPLADRLGVSIGIEAGSPPGCLIYSVKTMERLLAAEGLDTLRVLFDPAHYWIRGDDPQNAFETLHDKVVHFHAKDADGGPENIVFPPLGQGRIDFDGLAKSMADSGYDGFLAMEYEAFAWDFSRDHHEVLSTHKTFLDRLVRTYWN